MQTYIHIARNHELIICICKYPILKEQCEYIKVTPISFRHGKIITDHEIAKCKQNYNRITKCKNYLGKNICKRNNDTDDCIIPLLENRKAKCSIIQEYNQPILQIDEGFMLLNGIHIVNNSTTTGITLVQFTDNIKIDNITYTNKHNIT